MSELPLDRTDDGRHDGTSVGFASKVLSARAHLLQQSAHQRRLPDPRFCEHGARLKFSSMTATPDVVELYIPNRDESFRARVQWRNADEMGVVFEAEDALRRRSRPPRPRPIGPPAFTSSSMTSACCSESSTSCRPRCGRSRAPTDVRRNSEWRIANSGLRSRGVPYSLFAPYRITPATE